MTLASPRLHSLHVRCPAALHEVSAGSVFGECDIGNVYEIVDEVDTFPALEQDSPPALPLEATRAPSEPALDDASTGGFWARSTAWLSDAVVQFVWGDGALRGDETAAPRPETRQEKLRHRLKAQATAIEIFDLPHNEVIAQDNLAHIRVDTNRLPDNEHKSLIETVLVSTAQQYPMGGYNQVRHFSCSFIRSFVHGWPATKTTTNQNNDEKLHDFCTSDSFSPLPI